jgi:hypothetical protein
MVSLRFAQRLHAVFAPDFKVARVVEAHLPVFLFGTGLDKRTIWWLSISNQM